MTPSESADGPVSYIRSHVSDLPKVGSALKRMVFSDDRCLAAAEALNDYWKSHPDVNMQSIQYDENRKVFVLSHRFDGRFDMNPERFFAIVAKRAVQLLSEEVGQRIKSLLENPKEQ